MINKKERRRAVAELREASTGAYRHVDALDVIAGAVGVEVAEKFGHEVENETYAALADFIEPQPIDGNTSDGYHTFNELYHHRAVLFSVIVENFAARAWKSKLHADGTMYEGMFIVGIETPDGQATYHYDVEPYWNLFRCKEMDRAPEWDGHTPDQAIERIGKLVDCKPDRPTCRNIYDEDEDGACANGFQCSACGHVVEDYEGYRVHGTWNYCPNCGKEVLDD